MIDWLSEIFESSSDQARLVTAMFAALVAIIVVLTNQGFNSRRARKETLIEKIEDIYYSIAKIKQLHYRIINEAMNKYPDDFDDILIGKTNEVIAFQDELYDQEHKSRMLALLYFDALEKDLIAIQKYHMKTYSCYLESADLSDYLSNLKNVEANEKHNIDWYIDECFRKLMKIMESTMH